MTARATYRIALPHDGHATFYIYQDGFPQDAARYLLAAHLSRAHGSFADRFMSANERVELVESHEAVRGTQFRYTFTNGTLLAELLVTGDDVRAAWKSFFNAHYCKFINQYAAGTDLRLVRVSRYGQLEWMTRAQIDERIAELESYRQHHPGMVGNIASHKAVIEQLIEARAGFDTESPQSRKQVSHLSPDDAHAEGEAAGFTQGSR